MPCCTEAWTDDLSTEGLSIDREAVTALVIDAAARSTSATTLERYILWEAPGTVYWIPPSVSLILKASGFVMPEEGGRLSLPEARGAWNRYVTWCRVNLKTRWTSTLPRSMPEDHYAPSPEYLSRMVVAALIKARDSEAHYCLQCAIDRGQAVEVGMCDCVTCGVCHAVLDENHTSRCENCAACENCCTCYMCRSCDVRVSDLECVDCERCSDCGCSCNICRDCDNGISCDSCNRCEDCCACESRKYTRRKCEIHKFTATDKQLSVNSLRRLLGTEIEVSQGASTYETDSVFAKWHVSVVNDGSLPVSGSEIVTSPASGDLWVDMVASICKAMTSADSGAKIDSSCGLHVHVDAGDLNIWDVRRFVRLYAGVEQAVFDLTKVDINRCRRYARPCGDRFNTMFNDSGKDAKKLFMRRHYRVSPSASDRDVHAATQHKYDDARYNAVNLHSYFYRGTIEFRHHQGTVSADDITHWGIVVGSIVDFASRKSDDDIKRLLVQGRSRRKCLEIIVKQRATIDWMRAKWAAIDSLGSQVDISLIR